MSRKKEYAEAVIRELEVLMPEKKFEVKEITKNNSVAKTNISIITPGNPIAPSICIDYMYDRWLPVADAARFIQKASSKVTSPKIDLNALAKGYDSTKILPRIVNRERNRQIEAECPSRVIADLLLYYTLQLDSSDIGISTTKITNEFAEMWETSEEKLYEEAMKNLDSKADLQDLAEFAKKVYLRCGLPPENMPPYEDMPEQFTIVTTNDRMYGAATVLLPSVRKALTERHGDFILVPSSVHEMLAFSKFMSPEAMSDMIQTVNTETLLPEEVLSTHPYAYNPKTGELESFVG